MNNLKLIGFILCSGLVIFLWFQNKALKAKITEKEYDISTLQLSIESYKQVQKVQINNASNNKIIIQELEQEKEILQKEIQLKQDKIEELKKNDAKVRAWSEQKVPENISKILDF